MLLDLHIHTIYSDGDYSPREIFQRAKNNGVELISIADHDTVDAYLKENLEEYKKDFGVDYIVGIEISTVDNEGHRYHVLGYNIDLENKEFLDKFQEIREKRIINALEICECVKDKLGFNYDKDKILNYKGTVTKTLIGEIFINDSRNTEKLEKYFGKIPSLGEFIEEFIIPGKICYVKYSGKLSPQQAINLIHKAGGKAVLAHPAEYVLKGENLNEVLNKFLDLGIDGIEVFSLVKNQKTGEFLDISQELLEFSQKNDLIITAGSDFHSDKKMGKDFIDIGFGNYKKFIDKLDKKYGKIINKAISNG